MKNIAIINQRFGPNNKQLERFADFIRTFDNNEYGIIIGGDDGDVSIYNILIRAGFTITIIPLVGSSSGFEFNAASNKMTPLPLKDRNQAMLKIADTIIGLPQTVNELEDSPSWKTLRNASANGKDIFVISPAGWAWGLE